MDVLDQVVAVLGVGDCVEQAGAAVDGAGGVEGQGAEAAADRCGFGDLFCLGGNELLEPHRG